jgi:WhiB family redox-sensing transcriptional regulator
MEWMDDAVCREVGTELFFPEVGDVSMVHRAKRICSVCSVVDKCLDYGWMDQHGIYGGMTAAERQKLRQINNREARRSA